MTHKRRLISVLAISASIGASLLLTSPASATSNDSMAAAETPSFEIFYGPNCTGSASRIYSGFNRGEAWINDTFNTTRFGAAGYGQKIRDNAASVYVNNAQLWILGHGALWETLYGWGECFNLADYGLRNQNTQFQLYEPNGRVSETHSE